MSTEEPATETNRGMNNKHSPVINIHEETDRLVSITTGDGRTYDAVHDHDASGDWLVSCDRDDTIQSDWFLTRDDAIKYILQHIGGLEDATYERAPDRTH